MRECYLRHGCVIVRGAIAPALIEQARLAIDKAYQRTSEVHIDADAIAAASGGTLTGFELVAHPTLKRFRDLVYSGQLYFQESVTARRIQGSETGLDWQEPLTLHLDAQFHRFRFTMNFWVPLQDCGIEFAIVANGSAGLPYHTRLFPLYRAPIARRRSIPAGLFHRTRARRPGSNPSLRSGGALAS